MTRLYRYKIWIIAPIVIVAVVIVALLLTGDGGGPRLYPQF